MKVATILLAIAVASVSAVPEHKAPAQDPVSLNSQPAVRANAEASLDELANAFKHGGQSGLDVLRQANLHVVDPTLDVISGGAKATARKTASFADKRVADGFGALSAVNRGLGKISKEMTEFFYNTAAKNTQRYDTWSGASEVQDEAAARDVAQATEPLHQGAENVKHAAEAAKEKANELKDRAAEKADAAKQRTEEKADEAADATKESTKASGNAIKRGFFSVGRKAGATAEATGEALRNAGANVRENNEQKEQAAAEAQAAHAQAAEQRRLELVRAKDSSAMSLAAPGAAIAIAIAAAASII